MNKNDVVKEFIEKCYLQFAPYKALKNNGEAGEGRDKAAAINLVLALNHFRSTLSRSYDDFDTLVKSCPDFKYLNDAANASKHSERDETFYSKKKRPIPSILTLNQIKEVHIITYYLDQQGVYVHEEKDVMMVCSDGVHRDLSGIIVNVMNMWCMKLNRWGFLPKKLDLVSLSRPIIVPRAEVKSILIEQPRYYDNQFLFRWQYFHYPSNQIKLDKKRNALCPAFFLDSPDVHTEHEYDIENDPLWQRKAFKLEENNSINLNMTSVFTGEESDSFLHIKMLSVKPFD